MIERAIVELIKACARKTARTDASTGELVLAYTWPVRLVGWLGSVICVPGGLFMAWDGVPVKHSPALFVSIWVLMTVGNLWLLIESTTTRVRISDRGLVRHSAWHLSREIAWSDIVEISYRSLSEQFRVIDDQGTTIKIPMYMTGLGSFVQQVTARLPASVYQEATAGFLKVSG